VYFTWHIGSARQYAASVYSSRNEVNSAHSTLWNSWPPVLDDFELLVSGSDCAWRLMDASQTKLHPQRSLTGTTKPSILKSRWPKTCPRRFGSRKGNTVPKAYWVSVYHAVKDPDKLAAYAKLAGPAITAGGGRFLARGEPAKVYERGRKQRTVLIEFDSVEQAVATHDSTDYQAALAALGDGAEREIRIVAGV
jgi:uncharacterized protein (DUF1330 family)